MKNMFTKVLTGALAMVALSSCGNGGPSDPKTEITEFEGTGYVGNDYYAVTSTVASVPLNGTYQINVVSQPEQYVGKSIKFKSLDTSVATVSETGVVTGVKKGITDIQLSSEDGRVSTFVKIYVTEKSSASASKAAIDNIKAAYKDPSHVKCNKFFLREYDVDTYYCENVEDHGYAGFETMAFDYSKGYFMVQSEDLEVLTQHGATQKSSGQWIFYTLNYGQAIRLFHITPTGKTYMEFNPGSKYLMNEGEAILDLLDFFFASGRKIVKDMVDDVENERFDKDVTSSKVFACGADSVVYTASENGKDVVSAEDEINYFDIYEGTEYTYSYNQEIFQHSDACEGLNVSMEMSYKAEDKNWKRVFTRSLAFSKEFELIKFSADPKDDGFQLVDQIYDL